MGYVNPLLVEILAETHLKSASFLPHQFFDVVPKLRDVGFPIAEIGEVGLVAISAGERKIAENSSPRVRCWSEDRKRLVQLRPDMVVVNLVGQYPGWDSFLQLFQSAHDAIGSSIDGGLLPESLSLTTIDKFIVPVSDYRLGRYLDCEGPFLPSWYRDSKEAADINLGKGLLQQDARNRQIHVQVRLKDEVEGQIRSVFHDRVKGPSELVDRLEALHVEAVRSFESLVTDETRLKIMGGRAKP